MKLLNSFLEVLGPTLAQVGVSPEEFRSGADSLSYGTARLGLEIGHAASLAVPLAEAVWDWERFPSIHQFHVGLLDLVAMDLPPDLARIARWILAIPEPPTFEAFRLQVARTAGDSTLSPPERALARLVLFEAVRLNVVIATWRGRADLIRDGLDDRDLDRVAQNEVDRLLVEPQLLEGPEPVRPVHVLLWNALFQLDREALRAAQLVVGEVRDWVERRARLEELLAETDPTDAVLIRNFFLPAWGEQRVSIERLAQNHSVLLGGIPRNTLDQRLHRRLSALRRQSRPPAPRRGPSLIDLILESAEAK